MGQYFVLVNLDTFQAQPIGCYGEYFYEADFLKCFTKRKYSQARFDETRAALERVVPQHTIRSPSCKILRVPPEIIDMIFGELDRAKDIICLSLVDARLLAIGLNRVIQIQINRLEDCVGTRIVCLGDYSCDEDYPPSIKAFVDQEVEQVHPDDYPEAEDRVFYDLVRETYEERDFRSYPKDKHMDYAEYDNLQRTLRTTFSKDEGLQSAIYELSFPEYWRTEPMTKVLCNMSKRHYVRQNPLDDLFARRVDDCKRFRGLEEPTLEHALLSQICWSSDSSISMHNESLYQGAWVGDRFEVISMDDLEKKKDFAEWVDVSDNIVELLDSIWDDEFGWRATVTE